MLGRNEKGYSIDIKKKQVHRRKSFGCLGRGSKGDPNHCGEAKRVGKTIRWGQKIFSSVC